MERRKYLATISATVSGVALAGCSSDTNDGDSRGDETDGSEESAVPEPEELWQEGLPHCSTGDYPIRVRGFGGDVYNGNVNLENRGVEERTIYEIYAENEYEDVVVYPETTLSGGDTANIQLDSLTAKRSGSNEIQYISITLSVNTEYDGEGGPACWGDG